MFTFTQQQIITDNLISFNCYKNLIKIFDFSLKITTVKHTDSCLCTTKYYNPNLQTYYKYCMSPVIKGDCSETVPSKLRGAPFKIRIPLH